MYLDGAFVGENTEAVLSPSGLDETNNNLLGRSQWVADPNYAGVLDDFRIYDRALLPDEVASLAGLTEPFSVVYDLNVDGTADFVDYAALAEGWLDEELWPSEP